MATLFVSRYPQREIGQIKPGSTVTDKVTHLGSLGVNESPGELHDNRGDFTVTIAAD